MNFGLAAYACKSRQTILVWRLCTLLLPAATQWAGAGDAKHKQFPH
jgi:hypothetical protein